MSFQAIDADVRVMHRPLSIHHRAETKPHTAEAMGVVLPAGTAVRAVAALRKVGSGPDGFLPLEPTRVVGRRDAKQAGVRPPRRAADRARPENGCTRVSCNLRGRTTDLVEFDVGYLQVSSLFLAPTPEILNPMSLLSSRVRVIHE